MHPNRRLEAGPGLQSHCYVNQFICINSFISRISPTERPNDLYLIYTGSPQVL